MARRDTHREVKTETVTEDGDRSLNEIAGERFGGLDVPAGLVGMLVAFALQLILTAIVAAIAGSQFDFNSLNAEIVMGTLIGGVAIMFVAYLVGGWTAGRIARFDGALNGAMVAVWALLFAGLMALLGTYVGDEYNVFAQIGMPDWLTDTFTDDAIIAGVAAIVAMFLGATFGGIVGEGYHRRVDAYLERPGLRWFRRRGEHRRTVARD